MSGTQERRYTDHIETASDHDILIKLNTKVSLVCAAIKDTNDHLKDFTDKIDIRCEDRLKLINSNNDKIVGKSMFKWLIGLVIIGMITVAGIAGTNSVFIARHDTKISHVSTQIEKNAIAISKIIKER